MGDGSFPDWIVPVAIPGHVSWLLWIDNRVHAEAWHHRLIKLIGLVLKSTIVVGVIAGAAWWLARVAGATFVTPLPAWLQYYAAACAVNFIVSTLPWIVRRLTFREADVLLSNDARRVDLRPSLGSPPSIVPFVRWMSALPGNQLLSIAVQEKRLRVPSLPAQLSGLKIAHLSDVHITGFIEKPFYERIVELTNDARPDVVLLSGDLIENTVCWDWIPDTFGRLQAALGVYFVLGNHDVRIDHLETRRRLEAVGLVNLGTQSVRRTWRGVDVLLCGSERPWINDAPSAPIETGDERRFRILVSHSPDDYAWARRHDFDLMLAGHVHGGQIRIPPLGPILAPSRHGVRYACGVFHEPPTVLHVSRGASSKAPFRFFCPPELAVLTLSGPG
jgi:predicted MPP superfamily phosphohydrolase